MITDLVLRWLVTILFVVSAGECGYAIVTGHRRWASVLSQSLHIVMAIAMVGMAWPAGAALPTGAPMLFFGAATGWFVILVLVQAGHRAVNTYHAVMMLAMVWMYAVMSGDLLPVAADGAQRGPASMPGMPGMVMPGAGTDPAASPPFITALNVLFTGAFTVATGWWLFRLVAQRRGDRRHAVGVAAQAMMAAGMAVMFGVMV